MPPAARKLAPRAANPNITNPGPKRGSQYHFHAGALRSRLRLAITMELTTGKPTRATNPRIRSNTSGHGDGSPLDHGEGPSRRLTSSRLGGLSSIQSRGDC